MMEALFKKALLFNNFTLMREWRNGRRAGLRIRCRKAWGFSPPSRNPPTSKRFRKNRASLLEDSHTCARPGYVFDSKSPFEY